MHQKLLEIEDWEFRGLKDSHKIHQLHPYFAKYHSELPRRIIQILTKPGDVVLDPFSGSGTTMVEASLLGRNGVGIDMNPLACLMSKVKSTVVAKEQLQKTEKVLQDIEVDINKFYGFSNLFEDKSPIIEYKLPEFHNRELWFTSNALNELAIIKSHIHQQPDRDYRDFLLLAFSRIIVFASNQHGESRYTSIDKGRKPLDVFNQFKKTVLNMVHIAEDYAKHRKDVDIRINNKDARYIDFVEDNSVDLVVTSPPYLNSWDYGLYHRFRFFWLDMDVRSYEQKEIGKHLRTLEGRSKTDEVERYRVDMSMVLKELARILKKDKFCCIVNANSIVKKKFIDTNQILAEEGEKHGLMLTDILNRRIYGPHYGMHASLKAKNIQVEADNFVCTETKTTHKKEQILIFKKR